MKVAVRYSWRTAFFVFVLVALTALILLHFAISSEAEKLDKDAFATIIMLGVFASLPFFILAYRVSDSSKHRITPGKICISNRTILLLALVYWASVFYIALSGDDRDGMLTGFAVLVYPIAFIPMVILITRRDK